VFALFFTEIFNGRLITFFNLNHNRKKMGIFPFFLIRFSHLKRIKFLHRMSAGLLRAIAIKGSMRNLSKYIGATPDAMNAWLNRGVNFP
jgi:hypothetical protein